MQYKSNTEITRCLSDGQGCTLRKKMMRAFFTPNLAIVGGQGFLRVQKKRKSQIKITKLIFFCRKKESLLSKKERISYLNSIPELVCSSAIR